MILEGPWEAGERPSAATEEEQLDAMRRMVTDERRHGGAGVGAMKVLERHARPPGSSAGKPSWRRNGRRRGGDAFPDELTQGADLRYQLDSLAPPAARDHGPHIPGTPVLQVSPAGQSAFDSHTTGLPAGQVVANWH
jgi:hypothetical protein